MLLSVSLAKVAQRNENHRAPARSRRWARPCGGDPGVRHAHLMLGIAVIALTAMPLSVGAQDMSERVECHLPSGSVISTSRGDCRSQVGLVLRPLPELDSSGPASPPAPPVQVMPAPKVAVAPTLPAAPPDPLVASIQRLLRALGYDVGPLDGRIGPRTRSAIAAFQVASGMAVSGEPTRQLESALQAALAQEKLRPIPKTLQPVASGSGFYVSRDRILTNYHIVDKCDAVRIGRIGSSEVDVAVEGLDRPNDLVDRI